MRQIQVCAWLALALAACGGGEFSTGGSDPGTQLGQGGFTTAGARDPGAAASSNAGAAVDLGEGGATSSGSGSGGNARGGSELSSGASGSSAAGRPGGGGESGGAVAEPDECENGAITFRMLASPKLAADYLCDAGCGTGWLSITDAEGAMGFSIFSACGTASCDSCEVQQCAAAACLATPLTASGSELVWRGTYFEKDKCGATNMVCQQPACVKPGKYKARACAAVNDGVSKAGGCVPRDQQLCAEAEFELPSTKIVQLVLGN